MAEVIAIVQEVEGDVWARSADGEMRLLRAGDSVYAGETVVTAQDARVNLDLDNGETVQLAGGQSLFLSTEMLADAEPSSDEQAVTDPGVEEVLALLEGDGDILEELEDPAAGTTGGSDGGGRTIVEVTRIVEQIDPLAFDFAGPTREPSEPTPGVTGLAEAQAADEPAAPAAPEDPSTPEEPGTPEETTPSITVNLDDQNGQSVFESLISGTTTNVEPGQTVAIEVTDGENTVTTSAIVHSDGSYQVVEDLSSLSDGELTATATVSDQAGNQATDTDTAILDTEASATIRIDAITGDDVINQTEARGDEDGNITIRGSVGVDAGEGDTVTLTIWGQTFTGTVESDNSYAIDVPVILLVNGGLIDIPPDSQNPDSLEDQNPDLGNGEPLVVLPSPNGGGLVSASVSGSDEAGNPFFAQEEREYTYDLSADINVTLNDVNADNVTDAPISGETNDVEPGQTVSLDITDGTNTVTASATVGTDGEYSTTADLSTLDDGNLTVTASVTDQAGNEATNTDEATLDAVAGDLTVDATANNEDAVLDIEGTSQDVAEGDTVSLTITDQNGETLGASGQDPITATVDADGNYNVDGVDVSSLADGELTIDASATDNNGNGLTAQTTAALDAVDGALTVDATADNEAITLDIEGTSQDVAEGDTVSLTITDQNGETLGASGQDPITATVDADGNYNVDGVDVSSLADGELTIDASATDNNGNGLTAQTTAALDIPQDVVIESVRWNDDDAVSDVVESVWGSLDPGDFGVREYSINTANTSETVTSDSLNADESRNLSIRTVEGSADPYLLEVGQTYALSWEVDTSFRWQDPIWESREMTATVTRSDVFSNTTGNFEDSVVVFSGELNGQEQMLLVDPIGLDNWGQNYFTNDQFGSTVGFQQIEVSGSAEAGAAVEISDSNGAVIDTVTADTDGTWSTTISPASNATGNLTAVATDTDGNVSTDTKTYSLGDTGNDGLNGSANDDVLYGGLGNDGLTGDAGDDVLIGGKGDDTLIGGLGDDVFKWELNDQGSTTSPADDVITDFGTGNDVLDLRDLLVNESEQTIGDFLSVTEDNDDLVFQVTHDGGSNGATQTITLQGKSFADFGGAQNADELIQNMLDSGQLKIDT